MLPVLEIFNVCTDVNACDCMWPNTRREAAQKADFRDNSLAALEIDFRDSSLATLEVRTCVSGILGLTLIRVSYTPASIGLISDQ